MVHDGRAQVRRAPQHALVISRLPDPRLDRSPAVETGKLLRVLHEGWQRPGGGVGFHDHVRVVGHGAVHNYVNAGGLRGAQHLRRDHRHERRTREERAPLECTDCQGISVRARVTGRSTAGAVAEDACRSIQQPVGPTFRSGEAGEARSGVIVGKTCRSSPPESRCVAIPCA